VLQLLILVSLVGKGFVAVVASSRDGGGDSGSGTMFTRGFRTYISLVLVFCRWCTLFLAILVVFTVVANMVVVDFDGGVTMMEGTGGTMLLYASVLETQGKKMNLWLRFYRLEAKNHSFWPRPNMPRFWNRGRIQKTIRAKNPYCISQY